ncbi:hypothetical protein BGX31_002971 [Mortierella sp. GBA43]|nr:hypothetical protein BGX31_002971 [Mortierella sp. GBA43]
MSLSPHQTKESKERGDSLDDRTEKEHMNRRLFYLSAYSLTGAALMGSSIGLIVFQSLQSYYIKHLNLTITPGDEYHGSALLETPLNHPHQSTWMTMTHWIGDGQAQEAQSLSFEQALEQPCILSVLTPLTVVQYMAIILLGVATGLLTTGSANLEVQLDKEQDNLHQKQDQQRQQGHQEKTCLLLIDYEEEEEKDSTNDQLRALESSIESGSKSWLGPTTLRRGLTLKQRLGLCLWVLILFSSQIWFFQWIVTNGSLPTLSTAGAEGSVVSTSLTLFGLFSGTVMIALGTMLL